MKTWSYLYLISLDIYLFIQNLEFVLLISDGYTDYIIGFLIVRFIFAKDFEIFTEIFNYFVHIIVCYGLVLFSIHFLSYDKTQHYQTFPIHEFHSIIPDNVISYEVKTGKYGKTKVEYLIINDKRFECTFLERNYCHLLINNYKNQEALFRYKTINQYNYFHEVFIGSKKIVSPPDYEKDFSTREKIYKKTDHILFCFLIHLFLIFFIFIYVKSKIYNEMINELRNQITDEEYLQTKAEIERKRLEIRRNYEKLRKKNSTKS